jgi:hypothetical protein
MGKKGFPWRHPKKDDDELGSSVAKKTEVKPRTRVPICIDVALAMYNIRTQCEG